MTPSGEEEASDGSPRSKKWWWIAASLAAAAAGGCAWWFLSKSTPKPAPESKGPVLLRDVETALNQKRSVEQSLRAGRSARASAVSELRMSQAKQQDGDAGEPSNQDSGSQKQEEQEQEKREEVVEGEEGENCGNAEEEGQGVGSPSVEPPVARIPPTCPWCDVDINDTVEVIRQCRIQLNKNPSQAAHVVKFLVGVAEPTEDMRGAAALLRECALIQWLVLDDLASAARNFSAAQAAQDRSEMPLEGLDRQATLCAAMLVEGSENGSTKADEIYESAAAKAATKGDKSLAHVLQLDRAFAMHFYQQKKPRVVDRLFQDWFKKDRIQGADADFILNRAIRLVLTKDPKPENINQSRQYMEVYFAKKEIPWSKLEDASSSASSSSSSEAPSVEDSPLLSLSTLFQDLSLPLRLRIGASNFSLVDETCHDLLPYPVSEDFTVCSRLGAFLHQQAQQPRLALDVLLHITEKIPSSDLCASAVRYQAACIFIDVFKRLDAGRRLLKDIPDLPGDPVQPEKYYRLGAMDFLQQRLPAAVKNLKKVLDLNPRHAHALAKLLRVYLDNLELGRFPDATLEKCRDMILRLKNINDKAADYFMLYGDFLQLAGQRLEAAKVFEDAMRHHPNNPEVLASAAQAPILRVHEEITAERRRMNPNAEMMRHILCESIEGTAQKLSEEEISRSIATYEKAISLAPENTLVLLHYAALLIEVHRDPERVVMLLDRALELGENSRLVRQLYGRFLHEVQRDVPAALKQYELCLEVAEKEIKADVLLRIGVLSVLAEDFDRARSAFSEAADLDPPSCVTHKAMALFLLRHGDGDEDSANAMKHMQLAKQYSDVEKRRLDLIKIPVLEVPYFAEDR